METTTVNPIDSSVKPPPSEAEQIVSTENNSQSSELVNDKIVDCDTTTPDISKIDIKDQQNEPEEDSAVQNEQPIPAAKGSDQSNDESVANTSTEVNLDSSIVDRLGGLSISGDLKNEAKTDTQLTPTNSGEQLTISHNDLEATSDKPEDLQRSILAGEISDHSTCSVDTDEDDTSHYVDDKVVSGNVSDEEMSIENQDEEDVEEEEEFHEAEDKHKTSQESVSCDKATPSPLVDGGDSSAAKEPIPTGENSNAGEIKEDTLAKDEAPQTNLELKESTEDDQNQIKNANWADIMLSDNQPNYETPADKPDVEKSTGDSDVEKEKADEKKELDLDEDVKNPQYIPKRGMFYEHDDRTQDATKKQSSTSVKKDEEVADTKTSLTNKKSTTQERQNENKRGNRRQRSDTDRWDHDRFRYDQQKPKNKPETNEFGNETRQERPLRNQLENRSSRGNNNNSFGERPQGSSDNQRSRQNRDNRAPRQPSNRNGDRRPRRQNNRNRTDSSGTQSKRDPQNHRSSNRQGFKDIKNDQAEVKSNLLPHLGTAAPYKRDQNQEGSASERTIRNDGRGRRQSSKDRPTSNSVDDKFPPINTVMPPMTTWSNKLEDMVHEETNTVRKESPSRHNQHQHSISSVVKGRSNDSWPQSQPNKTSYLDKPVKNLDESGRHQPQQHYGARKHQDRDEISKPTQFINRNQYNDRSNQHQPEWRRTGHYNSHSKPNEYGPIRTQTFENSRLSQANMNRPMRGDAREIIERKMQNQLNFQQSKVQPGGPEQPMHHQQPRQIPQQHPQFIQHQHIAQHQQQVSQHLPRPQQQQQQPPPPPQPSALQQAQNQGQSSTQQQAHATHQQLQSHQRPHQAPSQAHPNQPRQNIVLNNIVDRTQDQHNRMGTNSSNANDLMSTRPIVKADAYPGANVASHAQQPQPIQQHSQNHRSLGGPSLSQQGHASASSHLVPSHLDTGGTQAQYYTPSSSSRDSNTAAAALATAYHGYLPSGHSVIDTTRYHMTSQQLSDHGYMASPGQNNDVATASVMHQQGMYNDASSAGDTVGNSAYLAVQTGSTLSPSANIPVTGAGPPPMAPVSYLQHSQYAPPPYSNPYSQPQPNQAPPQSSHPYPYWTYI